MEMPKLLESALLTNRTVTQTQVSVASQPLPVTSVSSPKVLVIMCFLIGPLSQWNEPMERDFRSQHQYSASTRRVGAVTFNYYLIALEISFN